MIEAKNYFEGYDMANMNHKLELKKIKPKKFNKGGQAHLVTEFSDIIHNTELRESLADSNS